MNVKETFNFIVSFKEKKIISLNDIKQLNIL